MAPFLLMLQIITAALIVGGQSSLEGGVFQSSLEGGVFPLYSDSVSAIFSLEGAAHQLQATVPLCAAKGYLRSTAQTLCADNLGADHEHCLAHVISLFTTLQQEALSSPELWTSSLRYFADGRLDRPSVDRLEHNRTLAFELPWYLNPKVFGVSSCVRRAAEHLCETQLLQGRCTPCFEQLTSAISAQSTISDARAEMWTLRDEARAYH